MNTFDCPLDQRQRNFVEQLDADILRRGSAHMIPYIVYREAGEGKPIQAAFVTRQGLFAIVSGYGWAFDNIASAEVAAQIMIRDPQFAGSIEEAMRI